MTRPAGSTGHGSRAHRGPVRRMQRKPRYVVPTPRVGDGAPEPVGLGEILSVDAGTAAPSGRAPRPGRASGTGRRADLLAGPLLLLAGLSTGVSLLVVWVHGGVSGFDLVLAGLLDAREDLARLAVTGSWQPLAVVGGGAVLLVLGLLMYVPARGHRLLGVLALLVSLVVAAAVLVPLAGAGWDTGHWAVGAWCAAAVGALGLLGGLEAMTSRS